MKFKEIGPIQGDLITTILKNRGIDNIELFLSPDNSSDTDVTKIKNIWKGIELIKKHINNNICLLVDSDCDGVTSASIMYQYLQFVNPGLKIDYYIHPNKRHGLTDHFMEFISKQDFDLIIVPDAGSNDIVNIEQIEKVYKADVLIIDHHDIELYGDYGVIINNQICENTNKNLTGAGMVFKFCEALEMIYNTGRLNELSDLAMLGLVGDSADLAENEVRNICVKSLDNINNNLIKAFYKVNKKDINNLIIKDLSFSGIIPMINAIVRVGTIEERRLLFETISDIVDKDKRYVVSKRKLNKEIRKYEMKEFVMDPYEYMIDIGTKVKARQDKLTKNTIDILSKNPNLSAGIQVFVIEEVDDDIRGITGLIANKLVNIFSQPVLVLWEDSESNLYRGSLRGYEKSISDFKKWCLDTELFSLVQGHPNAAGVELPVENYDALIKKTKNVEFEEQCYNVDRIYDGNVNPQHIYEVDSYRSLWYGGCSEPLFAIRNMTISKELIQLNKSTLKFYMNGVSFIKFRGTDDYEALRMNGFSPNVTINLIGVFNINEYNGKRYPQFEIKDYEIVDNSSSIFGGSESSASMYGIFA